MEKISDDGVTLTLVNINQVEVKTVIIQSGAYAEHEITTVTIDGQVNDVSNSAFSIQLAPGCGAQLQLDLKRFANQPTLSFPWDRVL